MKKLIEVLKEQGCNVSTSMSDDLICNIARGMGIEPLDYVKRTVTIEDYTTKANKTYKVIRSQPFVLGKDKDGKTKISREGLFIRLDVLDQALEDLLTAKAMRDA